MSQHDSSRQSPELATWHAPAGSSPSQKRDVCFVSHCFNEEGNVTEVYQRIVATMAALPRYDFRILFIDNASRDGTLDNLHDIVAKDSRASVIVNARNFGHIRSPFHAIMQASGDCVIALSSDLQEPPELAVKFLEQWERGASMVLGQKQSSQESPMFFFLRSMYYAITKAMAEVPILEHVTGFGLYDRRVIEIMRSMDNPYPYFRGMISEIGLPYVIVPFEQQARVRGITKNNFYTLYDIAMLGLTAHSKLPLRLATMAGFAMASLSLMVAVVYLILKLVFWTALPAGYAPVVIGVFFLGSIQIFLIGLLGEYIGAILTLAQKRPLVVERERIGSSGIGGKPV